MAEILERLRGTGALPTTTEANVYDCPKCRDQGYISWRDDAGYLHSVICECEIKRRNAERIRRAGLGDLVKRYTFESFQAKDAWQKTLKDKAAEYVSNGNGAWFFIGGNAGSGKTHICTAMVSAMMNGGKDCRYFRWRVDGPALKALVAADREEYETRVYRLTTVAVLYIDDFFKGDATSGDINLAFEMLDTRYNRRLPTIISSERSIDDILSIDEAVGGRIFEMSKGFCLKTQPEDWRLKR